MCDSIEAGIEIARSNGEEELFNATREAYRSFYGDDEWHTEMKEQANLAWMVCERNDDGSLKHYVMCDERGEA